MFERTRQRPLAIRLLGIALPNLGANAQQFPLFGDDRALHGAVDDVRERNGYDALRLALGVARRPRSRGPESPPAVGQGGAKSPES